MLNCDCYFLKINIMKTFIFILLLVSGALFGQEFRTYQAIADSAIVSNVVGKKVSYTYQSYLFDLIGRQIKLKENKKMIFSDEAVEGTKRVVPFLFFTENTTDLAILMTEFYSERMLGFNIYILNGPETKLLGFFPLTLDMGTSKTNKSSYRSQSLKNCIKIETNGTQFRISFDAEKLIIHPTTDREEAVLANEIKFLFNGKKLKEVKEF